MAKAGFIIKGNNMDAKASSYFRQIKYNLYFIGIFPSKPFYNINSILFMMEVDIW